MSECDGEVLIMRGLWSLGKDNNTKNTFDDVVTSIRVRKLKK